MFACMYPRACPVPRVQKRALDALELESPMAVGYVGAGNHGIQTQAFCRNNTCAYLRSHLSSPENYM